MTRSRRRFCGNDQAGPQAEHGDQGGFGTTVIALARQQCMLVRKHRDGALPRQFLILTGQMECLLPLARLNQFKRHSTERKSGFQCTDGAAIFKARKRILASASPGRVR
jgi:hypothetical protein